MRFASKRKLALFETIREFAYSKGEKSMMKYKARKFYENKTRSSYFKRFIAYHNYRSAKVNKSNAVRASYNTKLKRAIL